MLNNKNYSMWAQYSLNPNPKAVKMKVLFFNFKKIKIQVWQDNVTS